jgi:hypothetical protein
MTTDGIQMICEKRHHLGESDIFYPAVFCHVCRERIAKATEGNAYWDGFGNMPGNPEAFYATRWPICFAHKRCDRAMKGGILWMELREFVRLLAANLDGEQG